MKKKLDLRSVSKHHRNFIGFLNVPVQAPTRATLFTVIPRNHPISVAFYDEHRDTEDLFSSYIPRVPKGDKILERKR